MAGSWVMVVALGSLACERNPERDATISDSASACSMPTRRATILDQDGVILETWSLRLEEVDHDRLLPDVPAFLEYRAALERDGAVVVRPVADPPVIRNEAEADMWRDEDFNNKLVFTGAVGSIDPITCLDALLFSRQASRFSQVERPTEFLASVLRRDTGTGTDLFVVFGAGSEMFPPREAYGLDVVDSVLAEGWSYWYAIHNHTVQRNGDLLALGVPGPSTSDVGLSRALAEERGLQFAKVTNGFYSFTASAEELGAFRAR